MAGLDSNDNIFIGNDDFKREGNQLLDFCFDQILEILEKLNENKASYYPVLFQICILSANTLISHCQMTKKIENFINKLFKMADGYLAEYSKLPVTANSEKLSRNMINLTFESFRKKKEAFAQTSGAQYAAAGSGGGAGRQK